MIPSQWTSSSLTFLIGIPRNALQQGNSPCPKTNIYIQREKTLLSKTKLNYSHVLSQRQKIEAGNIEGEADRGVDVESEEDDLVDSKSGHTEQTFLLGFVLITLTVLIV